MGALGPERTVLVISGGLEAVPGIERVKALGVRVVVSDRSPDAPGFAVADDRILASTYDVEATVQAARSYHERRPIHGVLSIAADVPATVAAVAAELELPGLTSETARLATDKLAMKERFVAAGVPVPWFAPVESSRELAAFVADRARPLVVKPVDSRGARGVLRVTADVDPVQAFDAALRHSPTSRVMVEEFVDGPQLSTESIVRPGRVFTAGCSDRNYELLERHAPFIIENGGCQPSVHVPRCLPRVDEVIARAASAIGLDEGVLKGDLVLAEGGAPIVIEVAPRLSGGWFCTDQIPLSTGVDLVQACARLALGDELEDASLVPRRWDAVAVRYFFPPAGRLVAVEGVDQLEAEEWLHRCVLFVEPGEELEPVTDHTKRAGLVITRGATRAQAVERAERAVASVRFVVE